MIARGLSLVLALGALAAGPAGAEAATTWHPWTGAPTNTFRTSTYSHEEWIYTNGLFQAQGANSDGKHRTDYYSKPGPVDPGFGQRDFYLAQTYDFFGAHRATHNGDYRLPKDAARWPDGTADISELRLAADQRYLYVRFQWNSMPRPNAQIATLAFRSAAGAAGAARPWPRNARVSSSWDAALTVWGTGGTVARAGGGESPVTVRSGNHVTEARVPLSALPSGTWILSGGAGLDDPASVGHYWTVAPGDPTAERPGSGGESSPTNTWGLLFADDRPWSFDELHQGDDLASGSAARDTATVDPAALRRRTSSPSPLRTGDISRVFTSRGFSRDGITKEPGIGGATPPSGTPGGEGTNETWLYTGRQQYYGMHVPARYPASGKRWPLIVYLHGFTGLPEEAFHNPVGLIDTADRNGYLVATPLGRGDYFYRGEGDLDVLEVLRDVQRNYRIDPDRIYLMGHSMGGYGTNNVSMRHPDLFAAVAPAEGTDSVDLHANLRNVPWFEMSAEEDLDPHASTARALYKNLSEDGYDATLLVYQMKIHEYSSIYDTLPRLFRFFGAHRRVRNPATVTWTRRSDQDLRRFGLVYDGAYWVDGVRQAAKTRNGTVTLTSDAIAHPVINAAAAKRTDATVDEGGPTGRTKAALTTTTPAAGPLAPKGNVLHVEAENIGGVTAYVRRAGLRVGAAPLRIVSSTDAVVRLTLGGVTRTRASMTIDGRAPTIIRSRRAPLRVMLPSGRHVVVLRAVS